MNSTLEQELRAAAEKATPGPWKWWTSNSWNRLKRDDRGITQSVLEPFVNQYDKHPDLDVSEENMAFIALANPANILALLDRLEKCQAALRPFAALADSVDAWRHEDESTCEHRLYAGDIRRARAALEAPHA